MTAQTTDSLLNLYWSRSDRRFWADAARVPPDEWPAWRDERIGDTLSRIEHWHDPWVEAVPGELYEFAGGMGATLGILSGDTFSFVRRSASRRWYPFENVVWRRAEPLPDEIGYSLNALQRAYDARYCERAEAAWVRQTLGRPGTWHRWWEVRRLRGVAQPAEKHPEGNAGRHTDLVVAAAFEIAGGARLLFEDRAPLILAAIEHDVGKADSIPAHTPISVLIAERRFRVLSVPPGIAQRALNLIALHDMQRGFAALDTGAQRQRVALIRQTLSGNDVDLLITLMRADRAGRLAEGDGANLGALIGALSNKEN